MLIYSIKNFKHIFIQSTKKWRQLGAFYVGADTFRTKRSAYVGRGRNQEAIGKCLTDGAIPRSSGKNIVGSGIGIGVRVRPTKATLLGRESESTLRSVRVT